MIGLEEVVTAKQYRDQKLIDEGISQGISQGAFEMAVKIKNAVGIDNAVEISGFSRVELENEKLNKDY